MKVQNNSDYYTDEHILVCLSSSPTNPKIIRAAARMAQAFRGEFTALFVETPEFQNMSADDKTRLRENIRLAEQLGASVETTYGDDIALQIAEYARLSGVSKIVLGRDNAVKRRLFAKQTLTEKLTIYAPKLEVYILPDRPVPGYRPQKAGNPVPPFLSLIYCVARQFWLWQPVLALSFIILASAKQISLPFTYWASF